MRVPESARTSAAENLDINDEDDSGWPHNLRISRTNVPQLEKVYSKLRQQLKREPEDKMEDLNLNATMWGTFDVGHPASRSSRKLVRDQKEVHGISLINWQDKSWKKNGSVERPSKSVVNSESLRILRLSIVHGNSSQYSRKRMEG